ncbi:hypothetical protein NECAME_15443 [Necator americanus]|uniref:Sec39 domain-containing protein n=1 Tax=Necator americanus TaxID=51031 RepID=W2SKI3_NECAM|nr:hypothetical protein NECAME_15443 [Necator americanus]ETN69242.1 hypothetical protein NECAME_15443 [Necator americanus]
MKKPRRRRYESELDYTKDAEENSKILLREKYEMLRWTDTVEIKTPNLLIPTQIANYVESLPFCKFTVSPSADRFALMHHNRQLDVYAIDGQNIALESSLQVLEDEFAQYCLLEYSASGSLLLSTRSSAQIDVFDHQGGYCYDIPLESPQNNLDLVCAISALRTVANTSSDEKYLDTLYTLQYNGTFSVYKIGRLTRYQKLSSVSLDIGLAGTFCVLPFYNLLLVSFHYRASSEGGLPGGLCSFRLTDTDPFVEPIRVAVEQAGWLPRLPFSSASYAYLVSMSVNESLTKLAAVSSNGDFFLFDVITESSLFPFFQPSYHGKRTIPSTRIVFQVKYITGPRPVQAVFIENEEVGVIFHTGELVRSFLDDLQDALYSVHCTDVFTSRTTLVSPRRRELFILANDGGSDTLREVALQRTSLACRLWIFTLWSSFKNLMGIAAGDAPVPLEKATHSESLDFVLLHAPTRTLQELFERTLNERNYSRAKSLAESYDSIDIDIVLKREWRDICHSQTVTVKNVDNTLRQIHDKDWVIDACSSSDAPSLQVQKALVDLGTSFPSASLLSQVRLHHNACMLLVCEDVNEYIEVRNLSCLDAAFRFAKRIKFVSLDRLIEQNYSLLLPFMLDILSHIPPSVPPNRYEHLLPEKNGKEVQLDKLPSEELVRHSSAIFSLLKWKTQDSKTPTEDLKGAVSSFLLAVSQNNVDVLQTFRKERSKIVDKDMIVKCLSNSELTGDSLLLAVRSLGVCPELASSLISFHSRGVRPTFKQLWESTFDADAARRLLIRMARCGQAASVAEWETLRDEVLELARSIYSELIHPDEAIDIVTREMLSDTCIPHDKHILQLFLTLDKSTSRKTERARLSVEKSAEVLIGKSEELMQEASGPDDAVLQQSRSLAEAARAIAPKAAAQQLKLLDTVDLAHELGSTILPVAIRFAEPYAFLEEIVKLNGNYKQGKKCAKLAVLLGVETPVATALSLCALSALIEHDERYLRKYIQEVIAKGRDLPVVHELCIRIMESSFVPEAMDEIYACALLNAPQDKLLETLDLIQNHRTARNRHDHDKPEINDKLVIEPIYVTTAIWLTNISSSLALCTAMTEEEGLPWTKNDFLIKYEQALRFLEPQLNEYLVENVPPSILISQTTMSNTNVTVLDRISNYGCDRERFIEDPEYRRETIIGLAMTEDEDMYGDAIQLAADFKMNDWAVHFASLENALTSMSVVEAKALLKSRGHLSRLRAEADKFHSQLRASVGPLMTTNEQFVAYLTLFAEGQPEKAALPVLKRILEKKREVNAARLFSDAEYLCNTIISIPDRAILSLVDGFLAIPVGSVACEAAARTLLDGNDMRPAANPAVIFALLGKDETNFIDLVASKSISNELMYLERATLILEAMPNVDTKLVDAVRQRLTLLQTPAENNTSTPPEPFEQQNTMVFHRRRR